MTVERFKGHLSVPVIHRTQPPQHSQGLLRVHVINLFICQYGGEGQGLWTWAILALPPAAVPTQLPSLLGGWSSDYPHRHVPIIKIFITGSSYETQGQGPTHSKGPVRLPLI